MAKKGKKEDKGSEEKDRNGNRTFGKHGKAQKAKKKGKQRTPKHQTHSTQNGL